MSRTAHERAMHALDVAGIVLGLLFALFVAIYGGLFL